jgi:hypothetical protein
MMHYVLSSYTQFAFTIKIEYVPRWMCCFKEYRSDGTKTSELCNRLILLDHNKINLVLTFYAL